MEQLSYQSDNSILFSDMPKDCKEAHKTYAYSTNFEGVILPEGTKDPFVVSCKFMRESGTSCKFSSVHKNSNVRERYSLRAYVDANKIKPC